MVTGDVVAMRAAGAADTVGGFYRSRTQQQTQHAMVSDSTVSWIHGFTRAFTSLRGNIGV